MVDTTRPSLARMYDYALGGLYHFEIDRVAVERIQELIPKLSDAVWANRAFLQRSAKMIAEQGVRQFIDIGAGIPLTPNTHDIVRSVHPDATVVYIDFDEEVVDHWERALADVPGTTCLGYDLRDPALMADPTLRTLIDFDQPIGLMVVGVLDFVADDEDPWRTVRELLDAIPSGSFFAASHDTDDKQDPVQAKRVLEVFAEARSPLCFRTRSEFARFFDGLEMLSPYPGAEPRVTFIGLWGAEDPEQADDELGRWWYAGIARKP